MASANFDELIAFALAPNNDGQGFHDTPGDDGKETNEGVIYSTYETWCRITGKKASLADFKALTAATVVPIYRTLFWNGVQGDALPSGVDFSVADTAFGSGDFPAVEMLQKIVGVTQDGHVGPKTLAAVAKLRPSQIVLDLDTAEEKFYNDLDQSQFVSGWQRRRANRTVIALQLAFAAELQTAVARRKMADPTPATDPEEPVVGLRSGYALRPGTSVEAKEPTLEEVAETLPPAPNVPALVDPAAPPAPSGE